MPRCGCGSKCTCVFADGECTTVVGSGSVASPYRINVDIDPNPDNIVSCGPNGLLATQQIETDDSDCIALSGSGTTTDPLVAELTVDSDTSNLLQCTSDGALVQLSTADSSCIQLSGDGTAANPLVADQVLSADSTNLLDCLSPPNTNPGLRAKLYTQQTDCITVTGAGTQTNPLQVGLRVSTDSGNILECRPTGAYVPPAPPPQIAYRATLYHVTAPAVLPPSPMGYPGSSVFIPWDTIGDISGLIAHIGAGPAYPYSYIEIPSNAEGVYLVQAAHPTWSTGQTSTQAIARLRIWRGDVTGRTPDGIAQVAAHRVSNPASNFNAPYLMVSVVLILNVGDTVQVDVAQERYATSAFTGATLDVGPFFGAGQSPFNPSTAGAAFLKVTRLGRV